MDIETGSGQVASPGKRVVREEREYRGGFVKSPRFREIVEPTRAPTPMEAQGPILPATERP